MKIGPAAYNGGGPVDTSGRDGAAACGPIRELFELVESVRFPRGAEVRPRRLRGRADLNGRSGAVAKYDAQGGRVGVDFPPPVGLVSIRAANLEIGRHERARRRLEAEERRRRQEYGTRR